MDNLYDVLEEMFSSQHSKIMAKQYGGYVIGGNNKGDFYADFKNSPPESSENKMSVITIKRSIDLNIQEFRFGKNELPNTDKNEFNSKLKELLAKKSRHNPDYDYADIIQIECNGFEKVGDVWNDLNANIIHNDYQIVWFEVQNLMVEVFERIKALTD